MDTDEKVYLRVGGQDWYGWQRVSVQYGMDQSVRQFAATVTDGSALEFAWEFMPDEEVEVYSNGDLILTGYIDKMTPSYENANHTIEVTGRSKACDSVDCSHEHQTSELKNVTALDVANQLDVHGVGYKSDESLTKIPIFRLEPDETVHAAIERACQKDGLVMVGQPDGSVILTKAKNERVHPPLELGVNILGGSATFDNSERHQTVNVKGQRTYGQQAKTALRFTGEAKDNGVKRNRKRTIIHERDGTPEEAKKRAEFYRDMAYAKSISASIKVQGWHDSNGVLWRPNTLIYIQDEFLKLDRDMLLSEVSLTQDNNGTFSQLSLKDPQAFGGKSGSSNKKTDTGPAKVWNNPNPPSITHLGHQ